uniref:Cytochrome P450 n=1 Tax=Timema monikensis TaxID=170555 RepID=A0A7R9EGR1_9NEOP|nr:unnamed protein product [Timema monikensis]
MEIDMLIACVEARRAIWDASSKDHSNRHIIKKLWAEIGTILDIPRVFGQSKQKTVKDVPGPKPALPIFGTTWLFTLRYNIGKLHEAYAGTVFRQGEKWQELRSVLTPELTSAKTMLQFLPELHQVTEDFTSLLRGLRDGGNTIHNFDLLANKISLEISDSGQFTGICVLVLGRRLGFLDKDLGTLASRLARAVKEHFIASRDTYYGLPLWKLYQTDAYKRIVQSEEEYYDIISELVEVAMTEEMETCAMDGIQSVFTSILRAPGLDVREKKAGIIDFIAAGIQGLSNSLMFLLYFLAKHPDSQQRLFEEVQNMYQITGDSLKEAQYLHACVKESYRLLPAAIAIARTLETDMELSGHNIPAGTSVVCHTWLACKDETNFSRPEEFYPERWLPGSDRKSTQNSQFLVIPYGCGRRMCPGKRFVDQELHLILAKIVQEFEVKFDGEMGLQFEFFLAPGGPVNFTFIDRH